MNFKLNNPKTDGVELLTDKGISRRRFLIGSAGAGAGLLVGFAVSHKLLAGVINGDEATFIPNAFIRISTSGDVTLIVSKAEMGQSVYTSLPMLIAEELEVELDRVMLEHAPADDSKYADPILGAQVTGASTSIRGAWEPLRQAGAVVREVLIAAAAKEWSVNASECYAENGVVKLTNSERQFTYGELADKAARMPVPEKVTLKKPEDFKLIGKPIKRLDGKEKGNGTAHYGIDVDLPDMKIATIAMTPVLGGKVKKLNTPKAKALKGVVEVIDMGDSVAVIATDMWTAKQGISALEIEWTHDKFKSQNMEDIIAELDKASKTGSGTAKAVIARNDGDFSKAYSEASDTFEAVYQMPFLAHSPIEPMNATALVQKDRCDIWAGTQVPTIAQGHAAEITGLPASQIFVHNHQIGGAFGRRLDVDFIDQAVRIAKQVNYPVKLVWTREEDMQNDVYRPYYYDHLKAGLNDKGEPVAWHHRVTGASIMLRWIPSLVKDGLDTDAVELAQNPFYAPENILVDYVRQETNGMRPGWWRGVGATHNAFMVESFIDELAHRASVDPVTYRRNLLKHHPRALGVLELCAKKVDWGKKLPANHGLGISVFEGFGTYLAQVAEVKVEDDEVKVLRVVAAVDCGMVINPNHVVAQIEGGIVYGLTAALWGEITIENGVINQKNFDTYQLLRMNQLPNIEVHLVKSAEAPGGIGEPGTAGIAPAVTNAIYAASKKRIRELPVSKHLDAY